MVTATPRITSLKIDYDNPSDPGLALAAVIASNDWTQAEFATRCSLSAKHVNQLIKGKAGYGPATAFAFEMVTGIRCRDWLDLQAAWLTKQARPRVEAEYDARMARQEADLDKRIDLWPVDATPW